VICVSGCDYVGWLIFGCSCCSSLVGVGGWVFLIVMLMLCVVVGVLCSSVRCIDFFIVCVYVRLSTVVSVSMFDSVFIRMVWFGWDCSWVVVSFVIGLI